MPTCKSNVGNLMQHWTLCELLNIAQRQGVPGLNFIDAHAMAPLAGIVGPDGRFGGVRTRVQPPQRPNLWKVPTYVKAWHHLASNGDYPNSANFVRQVWTGKFSMLLCEKDGPTIKELKPWCGQINDLQRCVNAELFPGDWGCRFTQGLPTPVNVGLLDSSLTLVSFDPYKYDWHRDRYERRNETPERLGTLYPQDIERTVCALQGNPGQVAIQLSSYTANGANPQRAVISSVNSILSASGFTLYAVVRVDGNMMSLVYARGLCDAWTEQLAALPNCFIDWLGGIDAAE